MGSDLLKEIRYWVHLYYLIFGALENTKLPYIGLTIYKSETLFIETAKFCVCWPIGGCWLLVHCFGQSYQGMLRIEPGKFWMPTYQMRKTQRHKDVIQNRELSQHCAFPIVCNFWVSDRFNKCSKAELQIVHAFPQRYITVFKRRHF